MSNKETLALMLAGEQREYPWVQVLAEGPPDGDDWFGLKCNTIVEAVTVSMDFDEKCRGEIDAVGQEHYLRGPNAFDEQDLAAMEWEAKTEAANQ